MWLKARAAYVMAGLCRTVALLAAVVVSMSIAYADGAMAQGSGKRACGTLAINYRPTPSEHYTKMYISASASISCRAARSVMRRYRDDNGPCTGSSCYRSYPNSWTCDSVTPGVWPVIQECFRHRVRVVGWVRSRIKGPR